AVLRVHTNAFGFLRHFHFSTGLPGAEIDNQSARIIFIRDKSKLSIFAYRELLGVRPDMPAIDQFVLDWVDYTKPVGSFVRWRAIFIQTGGHSRRAAQRHKEPLAIWRCVNSARSFARFKGRDNGVRRSVNDANITGSFIADINKIVWRFS